MCGLCEYITKDLETLETHIATCETYKCNICDKIVTKLQDIKTHFLENHKTKESNQLVKHIKQNEDEFDEKGYSYQDLFPELCTINLKFNCEIYNINKKLTTQCLTI